MNPKHSKNNPAESTPNTKAARHSKNPLRRRSEMDLDIPRNTNADLTRVRSLRTPVFTRTRIMVLALALVAALSISGTLAYLAWTSNQTPNRAVTGEVELHIVEKVNGAATEYTDTNKEFNLGTTTKKVAIKAGTSPNRVPENVRVTFIPEIQGADYAAAVSFNEANTTSGTWGEITTDTTGTYIKTDVLRLYINPAYADYWTYSDGTFTSKSTLKYGEQTPDLLYGVTMADGSTTNTTYKVVVNVIADAIQSTATDAW